MNEDEREKIAAENREREKKATAWCPHCGTEGVWTYGGFDPAWLAEDKRKLTEFSDRVKWDGTRELGKDHTPARCLSVLVGRVEPMLVDGLSGWWQQSERMEAKAICARLRDVVACVRRLEIEASNQKAGVT